MKKLILLLIVSTFAMTSFSQSKTKVKEQGVKSNTVWDYDYSSGKEVKKIESVTKFNTDGLVTESSDYDKNGKLKERIVYTYNSNDDVIEEKYFDANSKPSKTIKYTYNGKLKLTREKYDGSGKLESKKVYNYEMQ
jgi:antitoxin component YwqK of YwqJK toxin-antitoxin module